MAFRSGPKRLRLRRVHLWGLVMCAEINATQSTPRATSSAHNTVPLSLTARFAPSGPCCGTFSAAAAFLNFQRNQTQTQFEHPPFYTCSFFEKKCINIITSITSLFFTSSNLNKPELAAVCSAGNQGRIGIDDRKYISFERGLTACLIIQCNIEGTKEGTLGCQKTSC